MDRRSELFRVDDIHATLDRLLVAAGDALGEIVEAIVTGAQPAARLITQAR